MHTFLNELDLKLKIYISLCAPFDTKNCWKVSFSYYSVVGEALLPGWGGGGGGG